ncbi:NUDIX hydrolase [Aureimonas populi]|uniref:NUDIX hydrolase n=1 Tax=Aureimonas populi TaxID=1701758 RepID=A0ABW5CMG7_9HYPH|nr:NUDIX hydrolase [Aureimonas populi]
MARSGAKKRKDVERQVAALPVRLSPGGGLEVLLVTSRETRRWVIPKGNPIKGLKRFEAAAVEAEEEAGVHGKIMPDPYRRFDYWKRRRDRFQFCRVDVFLLLVREEEDDWKERGQRHRAWTSPRQAFDLVLEPGLQSIFAELARDGHVAELLASDEAARRRPEAQARLSAETGNA